jgi:hypothetical protein
MFCGDHLVYAKLNTSNLDPGNECLPDLRWVIERIRRRWPKVKITFSTQRRRPSNLLLTAEDMKRTGFECLDSYGSSRLSPPSARFDFGCPQFTVRWNPADELCAALNPVLIFQITPASP